MIFVFDGHMVNGPHSDAITVTVLAMMMGDGGGGGGRCSMVVAPIQTRAD